MRKKLTALVLLLCLLLSGCAPSAQTPSPTPGPQLTGRVLIGRVVPLTGSLSAFGEGTPYVEQQAVEAINAQGGVVVDGVRCRLEMVYADSGSTVTQAAQAAQELIEQGVDVMIVSHTADTVSPVSAVCERAGIACISVDAPASAWAMGGPYQNSWHTFFDNEREMLCFLDVWNRVDTNRTIGLLTANDSEGIEITTFVTDFAAAKGYTLVDPGRYVIGTDDYTSIISTLAQADCDILLGVMNYQDFSRFWAQCRQQGFHPKLCTVAKACLFSSEVEALGEMANGLVTEVWWSEAFPYHSSINGWSSRELAQDYLTNFDNTLTMAPPTVGYKHANVEILYDILRRAGSLDLTALNRAAAETDLDTIIGHVAFNQEHISVTSCVAGQWVLQPDGTFRQEIVGNYLIPSLDLTAQIMPIPWP